MSKKPTKRSTAKKPPTKTTAQAKAKSAPKAKTPSQARGLGRGLSALMTDVSIAAPVEAADPAIPAKASKSTTPGKSGTPAVTNKSRGISVLAIDQIVRNPDQPRRYFDPALLAELTQSIDDKGVLQPILVRPVVERESGKAKPRGASATKPLYQIVAGERRWQAAVKAGLTSMPALIRPLSDQEVLEVGVIENVQRTDLNPIEEALAYRALIDQFDRTQQDVSDAIGKSRSHIANMLRLLTLPARAQDALKTGEISTGHARAIVAAPDPNALVEHIIDKKLSVRDAEDWVRRIKRQEAMADSGGLSPERSKPTGEKSADIRAVEAELRTALGLIVDLRHNGPNGELRLKYRTDDQLAELLTRLKRG